MNKGYINKPLDIYHIHLYITSSSEADASELLENIEEIFPRRWNDIKSENFHNLFSSVQCTWIIVEILSPSHVM